MTAVVATITAGAASAGTAAAAIAAADFAVTMLQLPSYSTICFAIISVAFGRDSHQLWRHGVTSVHAPFGYPWRAHPIIRRSRPEVSCGALLSRHPGRSTPPSGPFVNWQI